MLRAPTHEEIYRESQENLCIKGGTNGMLLFNRESFPQSTKNKIPSPQKPECIALEFGHL